MQSHEPSAGWPLSVGGWCLVVWICNQPSDPSPHCEISIVVQVPPQRRSCRCCQRVRRRRRGRRQSVVTSCCSDLGIRTSSGTCKGSIPSMSLYWLNLLERIADGKSNPFTFIVSWKSTSGFQFVMGGISRGRTGQPWLIFDADGGVPLYEELGEAVQLR